MEILHAILQQIVPIIVFVLEMMGVLIVFWTCLKSFGEYIQNTFMKKHNATPYEFRRMFTRYYEEYLKG